MSFLIVSSDAMARLLNASTNTMSNRSIAYDCGIPSAVIKATKTTGHRWFAVNTHPASEYTACRHLEYQGLQTFLPQVLRTIRSGRRIKTELRPHFPGYVFVRLNLDSDPWRSVDNTRGVRGLVKAGEKPVALPVGVVEALQEMTLENGQISFSSVLRTGTNVKFLAGPFAEMIGSLERLDAKGRVLVLLDLLGRRTHVSAHAFELKPAS
jgi:transcription antitermination factor NusG